jgi:hypothetical protein
MWDERQQALGMLMSWFSGRTMEWVADECARAGVTAKVSEAEMDEPSAPGIPRQKPGSREQEPPSPPQTSPPTRWTYTMHALPKDAQCWYAMGASDSTCSLPTAAIPAGMNTQPLDCTLHPV